MVGGPGLAVTLPSLSRTGVSWDPPGLLPSWQLVAAGCDDPGALLGAQRP